jgi:endonuclease/exonuclease/phosphatase family metal-dependent hydrolase
VVSTKLSETVEMEAKSSDRPDGQIFNSNGIRVWARTWAEIIEDANHRLKFVNAHLGYQPDQQQALEYLRATHAKYLPPEALGDSASTEADEPVAG